MSLACWPRMLLRLLEGSLSAEHLPGTHSLTLVIQHCHSSPLRGISMQQNVSLSRERRANWPSWFLLNWIMSQAVARETAHLCKNGAVRGSLFQQNIWIYTSPKMMLKTLKCKCDWETFWLAANLNPNTVSRKNLMPVCQPQAVSHGALARSLAVRGFLTLIHLICEIKWVFWIPIKEI